MARVIFHAGTHKTGTTTIQSLLAENRALLAQRGVYYPTVAEFFRTAAGGASATAHFAVADAIARFGEEDRRNLDAFFAHLNEIRDDYDIIIMSAESAYRHIVAPNGKPDTEEGLRLARQKFVERFAELFWAFPTEFLVYFRRHDTYMESRYSESITTTGNKRSFKRFLEWNTYLFDYRFQIDLFERYLATRIYCYEEKAQAGLVDSFFRDNGLGPAPASGASLRPSVPRCAVRWLHRTKLERPLPKREQRRRWLFALQASSGALFRAGQPSSFWRSVAQRDAFLEKRRRQAPELAFPEPEPRLPPFCEWTEDMHRAAESAFEAWQATNQAWIHAREAARRPPYAP